jgi:hypothetical protein
MKMFPRRLHLLALTLVALLSLASAQAVQLVVWDTQLQTKLGFGESAGGKLNLQLVTDYSGPVIALFIRDDGEKGSYPGLMPRYSGQLKGGVLTLEDSGVSQSIGKFLAPYKLTPSIQNPVKTFSLPGLKTAPAKDDKGKGK